MTSARPVRELSDEDLDKQADYAHATRDWVFHHGTSDQFAHHTERMLELEQEYLRRHPQRTWQGTVDAPQEIDEATRLRLALRAMSRQIDALLADSPEVADPDVPDPDAVRALLARVAAAGGRMHKLEIHQVARELGIRQVALASLYKGDRPLLAADRDERVLTEAGRAGG